jgi:N-acetylneuraminate synthase/sialic acid synthase
MPTTINISSHEIHNNSDCFIIAEIGHNHQGNLKKAMELFHAAKDCGVDAVKLQKRDNRSLYTRAMFDKPYDNENSFGETYGKHREALEFGKKEYIELQQYAKELDMVFFSTAFDIPSADFLAEINIPVYKIASGDLKNTPLLKHREHWRRNLRRCSSSTRYYHANQCPTLPSSMYSSLSSII